MEVNAFSEIFLEDHSDAEGNSSSEDSDTDFEEDNDGINDEPVHNPNIFNWKKIQNGVNFEPNLVDFLPPPITIRNPVLTADSTPFEILRTLITEEMISNIAAETNRFAEAIKATKPNALINWKPVDTAELWRFFALDLLMGVIKMPWIKDYWSTKKVLNVPIFGEIMSRNRYEYILRALHFCNNDEMNFREDRFRKLGTFLPDLMRKFTDSINPSEFLCVDESLVNFKGRLSFRQYNPMKRARFGIKLISIVDCSTRFLLRLIPYQGKTTQLDPQFDVNHFGFGGSAVCTLLKGLFYKSHKVIIDNWFHGPKLAKYLLDRNVYVLGTVRKSRKGMPRLITRMNKGDLESYTDGNMLIERWYHRREVVMLNSFVSHQMLPTPRTENRAEEEQEMKPKTVLLYNQKMGAVDSIDQQVKPYESMRKTIKWYKKIALHLLDLAVHNSFCLQNSLRGLPTNKKYKGFVLDLIEEIFNTYPATRKLGRPSQQLDSERISRSHMPGVLRNEEGKRKRRECAYHNILGIKKRLTADYCLTCKKHLCVGDENSCFVKFHSEPTLPKRKRLRVEPEPEHFSLPANNSLNMEMSQDSEISISLLADPY